MKDFRQLKVWEKAHQLVLLCYKQTVHFPREEKYGLTSQIRRCSSSIPTNIAEACGRGGNGDFQRFLQIAMGSAMELEYHWLLARDLGLIETASYDPIAHKVQEVSRMLACLIRKVEEDRKG